jgi:hypothetical protein
LLAVWYQIWKSWASSTRGQCSCLSLYVMDGNLKLEQCSINIIQTLHSVCIHIEDVHLLLWADWRFCSYIDSLFLPIIGGAQDHYGFHSFPVVDWFCLFIYLWVLTFPLKGCSEFGNFVITLIFNMFRLCTVFVYILKMCTSYYGLIEDFVHILTVYFFNCLYVEFSHFLSLYDIDCT